MNRVNKLGLAVFLVAINMYQIANTNPILIENTSGQNLMEFVASMMIIFGVLALNYDDRSKNSEE